MLIWGNFDQHSFYALRMNNIVRKSMKNIPQSEFDIDETKNELTRPNFLTKVVLSQMVKVVLTESDKRKK